MTPDPGLVSWLQLTLTPGLGPSLLRRLLQQFGLPEAILAKPRDLSGLVAPSVLDSLYSEQVQEAAARAVAIREVSNTGSSTDLDSTFYAHR